MTPFAEITFIPLLVEAILYGLYFATLVHCLRWLLFDDVGWCLRQQIGWHILCITITIFFLVTTDLLLELRVFIGPSLQADVLGYIAQDAVSRAIRIMLLLVFDAVLVYRCWIVYAKSWWPTCPALILWLSCLISAIFVIYYNSVVVHPKDTTSVIPAGIQMIKLLLLFLSCSIAANIYSTFAIVYRILTVTSRIAVNSSSHLRQLSRIIVESGALYTFTSIVVLATLATDLVGPIIVYDRQIALNVFSAINFLVAGICFNLILIRVGHVRTHPKQLIPRLQTKNETTLSTLQPDDFHTSSEDVSTTHTDEERGNWTASS